MQLRTKVILLGVVPLLVSLALIALAVRHQATELAVRQHEVVEREYMRARRDELKHYVELGIGAIRSITSQDLGDAPAQRAHALSLLATLDYGADGYFFVYDLQGTVLMHSRQPELVGRNLWELRDPQGQPTIQLLIAQARSGGGFVDYVWRKPSTTQVTPKLGYVTLLQPWQWMVGSGLYLDDIQATMTQLDREAYGHISTTLLWIAGIAASGAVLIGAAGLALNLSEHRVSDGKLRLLARQVVQSQEDERAHLSRELHDGVSQTLVSTKLLIETAADTLGPDQAQAAPALDQALQRLNASLNEVRRISHSLRPALLDTLGLPAALQHLGREFQQPGGPDVHVAAAGTGVAADLPAVVKTVLFRVAQEALTNSAKHAQASKVEVALEPTADSGVRLRVSDDGQGFDHAAVQRDPARGIGLRNMRERLTSIGGHWHCETAPGFGTQIVAEVPARALHQLARTG